MIPGIEILVSTVIGAVGGIANKWLEKGIKEDERKHELSMRTFDMEESEAEREHASVLLDKNAKMAEAEAEWKTFQLGQVNASADTGISWVNAARSMTRVFISVYLIVVTSIIAIKLSALVGGLESMPHDEVVEMYKMVIQSVLNLTGVATGYWFSSRFNIKMKS